ncbi:hypothetical protein [Pseudalkalibacillus berkeleyi]|uniref:N-acetyltransferase domain-containing protein n=1 Tax=Pseudalkalibacillus berkeleyi TaxID=1069813 RepID=A0ABS9H1Z7_9BACL|nr:hypothetical protein [Pseudalkalibacillus berkeleyi]MCF6139007.1 hypothetical protein [Pseudalkalibacillus berkeleyi]
MKLTIRPFEDERDMDLQYAFWESVTADLPYAWKPTLSPIHFKDQKKFDPKTRCFAFDGDELVGHMGFTGEGKFVSLGYPWVREGYEGVLQEEMFERIHGYAVSSDYGAEMIAQRFRSQWKDQIAFFKSKGFEETGRSPIYGRPVTTNDLPRDGNDYQVAVETGFNIETFVSVAEQNDATTEQDLTFYRSYYNSVDFDFAVACNLENTTVAYFGVTVRKDTGYSEIIAFTNAQGDSKTFREGLSEVMRELTRRGAKEVGIYEASAPEKEDLTDFNFKQITEDVMLMKKVNH